VPHLARGQENQPSILGLYAVDASGHLYDPVSVEFRVIDLSTGTQVFPGAGLEDVTAEGRVSKGIFYAVDTVLDVGWTPEVTATVGAHRIEWTYTDADGTTVRTWFLDFDVSEVGTGVPYWAYLSPVTVRNEGIDATELSDARLVALIKRVQQHIERVARQPFRPIVETFRLDGSGSALLPLAVPVIGINTLKINHSAQVLDPSGYRVYFNPTTRADPGWMSKDYRRNPKIVMTTEFTPSPFNTAGLFGSNRLAPARFQPGAQPHELSGVFGYLEGDGTTPAPIAHVALLLALANTPLLEAGSGGGSGPGGPVIRERTDRHEVEYARPSGSAVLSSAWNTSPEVEDTLRHYRAPIGMASPASRFDTARG